MTPREAMKVLSAGVTSKEVEAERVLLRTIEQHEAALTELRDPLNWTRDGDDIWVNHDVLVSALTKGNP